MFPPPAGVAQVASPRQKVEEEADVPLLRLVTGRFPVTPVVSGKPVAFVKTALAGVPRAGAVWSVKLANEKVVHAPREMLPVGAGNKRN